MTYDEVLRKAINTYGIRAQMDMMIEEMSELTKALLKYRRYVSNESAMEQAKYSILEEIADVYIVLEQMVMIFDTEKEVPNIIAQKLERLEKRINSDYDCGAKK